MWKILQEKPENQPILEKSTIIFKDIKIPDIFYKTSNFLETSWALIITTYIIKH